MNARNCSDFNMVNTVNFNIHYCYGEQKTILSELYSPNHNNGFSTDTDIGSKNTDISVRNTEHNFTKVGGTELARKS